MCSSDLGTVGKTTAKDLTAAVVGTAFKTHRSEGNLNSREGLPLALFSLQPADEVSILEMGMDSPGEIRELCGIAQPDIGVVLNIGLTHVSKLGSIEAIAAEKLSLARYLGPAGTAALNLDDALIRAVAANLSCKVIGFGACRSAALQRGDIQDRGLEGTRFDVNYAGEMAHARSPLPGAHVVPSALAAMAVGLALGMSLPSVVSALANVEPTGRITPRAGANGATILDDRYNASPASVAGALELLRGLPGRRIALLGKMAELGQFEVAEHEKAGRLAAECCDILFCFGPTTRTLADAASAAGVTDVRWFETKDEAAAALAALLAPGDVALVKGSRSEALETILPLLEGAG